MADAIRFYMDQHFPSPASLGLRRHGIEVLTAQDAGRCGYSDADQLAFSTAEQRVLVTFDPDFLVLHQSGVAHAGLVWCQALKYSIGQLIQMLMLLHGVADGDSMRGHLEYL